MEYTIVLAFKRPLSYNGLDPYAGESGNVSYYFDSVETESYDNYDKAYEAAQQYTTADKIYLQCWNCADGSLSVTRIK